MVHLEFGTVLQGDDDFLDGVFTGGFDGSDLAAHARGHEDLVGERELGHGPQYLALLDGVAHGDGGGPLPLGRAGQRLHDNAAVDVGTAGFLDLVQRTLDAVEHAVEHARAEFDRERQAGGDHGLADGQAAGILVHLHEGVVTVQPDDLSDQLFLADAYDVEHAGAHHAFGDDGRSAYALNLAFNGHLAFLLAGRSERDPVVAAGADPTASRTRSHSSLMSKPMALRTSSCMYCRASPPSSSPKAPERLPTGRITGNCRPLMLRSEARIGSGTRPSSTTTSPYSPDWISSSSTAAASLRSLSLVSTPARRYPVAVSASVSTTTLCVATAQLHFKPFPRDRIELAAGQQAKPRDFALLAPQVVRHHERSERINCCEFAHPFIDDGADHGIGDAEGISARQAVERTAADGGHVAVF